MDPFAAALDVLFFAPGSSEAFYTPKGGAEGLRMSGMYERMAWGAIEDLARIAGVSLAEQGA